MLTSSNIKSIFFYAILVLTAWLPQQLQAAIPEHIDYQAYLTDSSGSPITGTVSVTFSLYSVDAGGIALWSDTQSITPDNGLFSIKLGSISNPFPVGMFDEPLWLEIEVASDGAMTPRITISSAGFAHKADDALTLDGQSAASLDQSAHVTATGNPHSVTAAQTGAVSSAEFTLHTSDASAHHAKYTDIEAVAAMGPLDNSNPLNHDRRTGAQVFNAVLSRDGTGTGLDADLLDGLDSTAFMSSAVDNWVNISGDTMTGDLYVLAKLGIGTTTPTYKLEVIDDYHDYLLYVENSATIGAAYGLSVAATAAPASSTNAIGAEFSGTGGGTNGHAFATVHYAYASGSSNAYGVYMDVTPGTTTGTEYAFFGHGDGFITGTLGKGAGSFKIDHPLDPENKYLSHSFVESPDMMNVYNGNVKLDENGSASVTLPDWFNALNRDFRYQLTPIGAPGPNLYVADKIKNNRFRIAGGTPGLEVSWMVTGIRQDPYANSNRIQVEEEKKGLELGTYLHPEAYGLGRDRSLAKVQAMQLGRD